MISVGKYADDFRCAKGRDFRFANDWRLCIRDPLFWGRLYESSTSRVVRHFALRRCNKMFAKRGCELTFNGNLGGGMIFGHGYNVTINCRTKTGYNCCFFKGCTIGSIRSGKREGVPVLGDRVTVGCNAFVCGGITIGNDVLIAANAFVDFDVPSHSIVIGNPGVIHHKEDPCRDYRAKEVL